MVPRDGSRFLAWLRKAMISTKPWRVVQSANVLDEEDCNNRCAICTMREQDKDSLRSLEAHSARCISKKANQGRIMTSHGSRQLRKG